MLSCAIQYEIFVPCVRRKPIVNGGWFRHVHPCLDKFL